MSIEKITSFFNRHSENDEKCEKELHIVKTFKKTRERKHYDQLKFLSQNCGLDWNCENVLNLDENGQNSQKNEIMRYGTIE